MDIRLFSCDDFKRLIASEGGPHLSLYLPRPTVGNNAQEEDRIRFGNSLRAARQTLTKFWMTSDECRSFLQPVKSFLRELMQLSPRTYGVAMFVCNDMCEIFQIDQELNEELAISRNFKVRPLIPCLDALDPYYLLTLSKQRVRLLVSKPTGLEIVTEAELESFEQHEARVCDETRTQVRVAPVGGRSRQGIVFHGQGDLREIEKTDLAQYLRQTDREVCKYLNKSENFRLLLAGTQELTTTYRMISMISDCKSRVISTLSGNVDHLSIGELQCRVEADAAQFLHNQRDSKLECIREHDFPVSTDPEQILVAAFEGRISDLFIDDQAKLYGYFLPEKRTLKVMERAPSEDPYDCSHDLIELAATQTVKNGGNVYAIPTINMPFPKTMIASLRF